MKIAIIIIGIIAIGYVPLQLFCRAVAKKSREGFDNMSSDEQRKYQEDMYKCQQMG